MDINVFSQIIFEPHNFSLSMLTKDYDRNVYTQLIEFNNIAPFMLRRQTNQTEVEYIVKNTSWRLWRTLIEHNVEYGGILITAKDTHRYSAIVTHRGTNTNSKRFSNLLLNIHSHPYKVNGRLNKLSYTPSMKDYSGANGGIYLVATRLGIIIYGTYDTYDITELKAFLLDTNKDTIPHGIVYALHKWDTLI